MTNYIHKSTYFYGNKISDYGLKNGRVDYSTLVKSFDAILNNDIMSNTADIGFWEQVNGFIDNSDKIEELTAERDEVETILCDMVDHDQEGTIDYKLLENRCNEIEDKISELEEEQDYPPEIYQYYIISDQGAQILNDLTNEIVFYNAILDMYVWGVCHYGTAWDHVLTDIPVMAEG